MIPTSRFITIILTLLLTAAISVLAQSQTSSNPSTTTGSAAIGALIAYWISNSRKRQAIGGWLLYFYIQLFGGAIISFLLLFTVLQNFNPELWDNQTLYSLYLLSTVPPYVSTLAEVTVGSMLLSRRFRNPQTINWLRIIFIASFVFAVVGFLIDSAHWPENTVLSFFPLAGSAFWFLYFTRSKRVDLVFRQANWDPNMMYPLASGTARQRQYSEASEQGDATCSHKEEFGNFCTQCGVDLREDEYDLIGKKSRQPIINCSHFNQSGTFCSTCGTRLQEFRDHYQKPPFASSEPIDSDAKKYGAILGLAGKVTIADIKKAYKDQMAKYHPDKVQHLGKEFQEMAEKKTKEIAEAYQFFRQKFNF